MKTVRTWWGKKFIEALQGFIDPGRLERGRGYANEKRITQWAIEGTRITASIRGNINPYFEVYTEPLYNTWIELKAIGKEDWAEIIQALGSRAAFVSRLLLNEVPDNIEEPFAELGLRLLPLHALEMKTSCSCPDSANPCKHIAGLDYFLAARLDQDPFLLFELRGLPRAELLRQLRQTPLGHALAQALDAAEQPLLSSASFFTCPQAEAPLSAICPEEFWRGAKRLPTQIEPAIPPAVAALNIKKGGDFPAFWNLDHSFIATMEAVYEAARKREKAW